MISSAWRSQIFEKKILAAQIWVKQAKIRPKMSFFAILLSLDHTFSLILHAMIACDNVQQLIKTDEKNLGDTSFGQTGQIFAWN